MELGPVGRTVLHRAHPDPIGRVIIDGGKRLPSHAAIGGPEHALRRGAGVPNMGLARRTGLQPECVVDGPACCAVGSPGEGGRPRRFSPAPAQIARAENGRAKMASLGRRQQSPPIARIEHEMADDMAEEMRPVGAPTPPRAITAIDPRALARGDPDRHAARSRYRSLGSLRFAYG